MIKRMRLRVGVYASALLLLVGVALIANATTPVTRSEMEAYFWERMAAGGGVLFAAVWVLLQSKTSRIEQMLDKLAEGQVMTRDALTGLISEHKMIRENEEEVCAVLRLRRAERQDQQRHGDPDGFDPTGLRK